VECSEVEHPGDQEGVVLEPEWMDTVVAGIHCRSQMEEWVLLGQKQGQTGRALQTAGDYQFSVAWCVPSLVTLLHLHFRAMAKCCVCCVSCRVNTNLTSYAGVDFTGRTHSSKTECVCTTLTLACSTQSSNNHKSTQH
jgi:hypothetical protein